MRLKGTLYEHEDAESVLFGYIEIDQNGNTLRHLAGPVPVFDLDPEKFRVWDRLDVKLATDPVGYDGEDDLSFFMGAPPPPKEGP